MIAINNKILANVLVNVGAICRHSLPVILCYTSGVLLCTRCQNGAFCMEFEHFRFESGWVVLTITIQIIIE